MTRGDLKLYALARCAGLKNSITNVAGASGDTILELMIQKAADDVAMQTLCMKANQKFNVEADINEYSLSESVDNFCALDTPGLYWNTGDEWKWIKPKTIEWLDENRRNWRDEDSGDPEYFAKRGNNLLVVPAPVTTLANGFWLYFHQHAYDMSDDANVPFYGATIEDEISEFSDLDEAIVAHVRWKSLGILGKNDEYRQAEVEYNKEVSKMTGLLMRNKAVQGDRWNKLQGRRVR